MSPGYSDYLESMGLDAVFMIKIATCDVDKENQPIQVVGNPDLYPKDDAPKHHWSAEG